MRTLVTLWVRFVGGIREYHHTVTGSSAQRRMSRIISENGLDVLLAALVSRGQESSVDNTTSDVVSDLDVLARIGEVICTD